MYESVTRTEEVRVTKTAADEPKKIFSAKVDHDVFRQIKIAAVIRDVPMTEIVGDALRLWLKTNNQTQDGSPAGA